MSEPLTGLTRTYVLDTNVLIHDPTAVLNFDEHHVVLPMAVLEELDGMKQEQSDRGRQARQVTRLLDDLMDGQSLAVGDDGQPRITLPVPASAEHAPGTLQFAKPYSDVDMGLDKSVKDNQILATAFELHLKAKQGAAPEVILVTNDTNMRVKAAAVGLPAEGYRNDAVFTDSDAMADGVWRAEQPEHLWDQVTKTDQGVSLQVGETTYRNLYRLEGDIVAKWYPGMMVSDGMDFEGRVLDIVDGAAYVTYLNSYRATNPIWGVRARDELQNFALNLLLDSELDLVTLAGPAGTGKTFLALAAAMKMVFDDQRYEKIIITRETVAMGEEIGFLPGTEEEKMAPWMGAFMDNIEQLVGLEKGEAGAAALELIKKRLQMRSLGLMRGRSFSNAILIVDEAQNLTPKQVKNLITRAGQNTKIICLGNVAQIDTPYLNPGSTGLANLVQKFRPWQHAGHVTLRSIERSRLAAKAEEVL
jgi:PhoH-like ATPase